MTLVDSHPDYKIDHWGFEKLKDIFSNLEPNDWIELLGPAPTERDLTSLTFEELELVLVFIANNEIPNENPINAVPSGKIEANALSTYTASLLLLGMQRTTLIENLFKQYHDPLLGDKVAIQFINKYQELRKMTLLPDDIFSEIYNWAIGDKTLTPKIQVAVYTIIAYFFESCDIFEPPKCERLE